MFLKNSTETHISNEVQYQFRQQIRSEGIRSLIKHRVWRLIDRAYNARPDEERYNQRVPVESVN